MRHKLLVLTVKKILQSVYIYGSYRKIKTGVPFFWTTRYIVVDHSYQHRQWFCRCKAQFFFDVKRFSVTWY